MFQVQGEVGQGLQVQIWATFHYKDSSNEDSRDIQEMNFLKEEAELSLNAMTEAQKSTVMKFMAWIGKHEVTLLIDSSSSNNFINSNIIKKVDLQGKKLNVLK